MGNFKIFSKYTALLIAGIIGGCYSYDPVPPIIDGDTYTGITTKEQKKLPADYEVLSLEMAEEVAIANNPDYISKQHAMAAAWSRYYQAIGAYFPTVTGGYNLGETSNNPAYQSMVQSNNTSDINQQIAVTGQWTIFNGLIREMNLLIAKHNAKSSEYIEEDTRRLLIKAIATQYNNVLLAVEKNRIATTDMEFQQKLLAETQLKYEAGAVPLSDVLNFKVKVNVAEGNQLSAQYEYNTSKYALAALMGLTEGTVPDTIKFPSMKMNMGEKLLDIGIYLDTAFSNRPDLKSYREILAAAEYNVYAKWGAFSPTVAVNGGLNYTSDHVKVHSRYGNRTYGESDYTSHSYNRIYNYGTSVSWLLFDGNIRYEQVREAQALVAQNQYQLENKWISVVQDVRAAYDNYVQNTKKAVLYQKTLAVVTKQRDLVEEEYKAGNIELTRLNEAQTALVQADTDFVTALINVQNAKAQLEAATSSR